MFSLSVLWLIDQCLVYIRSSRFISSLLSQRFIEARAKAHKHILRGEWGFASLSLEPLDVLDEQTAGQFEIGEGKIHGGSVEDQFVMIDMEDGDQPFPGLTGTVQTGGDIGWHLGDNIVR